MPLYVYHCPSCGREFELLRPGAQRDTAARCDSCGEEQARRSGASYASAVRGSSSRGSGASVPCGGGSGFT